MFTDSPCVSQFPSNFIKNNQQILKVYSNLFSYENKAQIIDPKYYSLPNFDPEMPVYRENWLRGLAESIRKEFRLDKWLRIASVSNLPLGIDYLEMDEFWELAITETYNAYAKEQDDKQKEYMHNMEKQIENLKPHQSAFSGVSMPNFNQK